MLQIEGRVGSKHSLAVGVVVLPICCSLCVGPCNIREELDKEVLHSYNTTLHKQTRSAPHNSTSQLTGSSSRGRPLASDQAPSTRGLTMTPLS